MLESELKKLTSAVEANTAALLGGATPVAADAKAAPVAANAAEAELLDTMTAVNDPPSDIDIPAPEATEVVVTLKEITEGIVALCKAKNREAAAKLMAEYGAQKVPDLKKVSDKYGEILAKINALISAK